MYQQQGFYSGRRKYKLQTATRLLLPGISNIVTLWEVCELIRQFADFGLEGGVVARGVGEEGAEAGVEFDGAGFLGDFGDVGGGDAGAGDDDDAVRLHGTCDTRDAVAGGGDEFGELCGSLQSSFRARRSEDSCGAGLDDGFERAHEVGNFVERAVKRHRQGASEVHEPSRARDVNFRTFLQDS